MQCNINILIVKTKYTQIYRLLHEQNISQSKSRNLIKIIKYLNKIKIFLVSFLVVLFN